MKNRIYILYTFISVFALGTAVPTIAMFKRIANRARRVGQVASLGARNRNVFTPRRNRSTSQYQTPQRRHILTPRNQNPTRPSASETWYANQRIRNQFNRPYSSGRTNNSVWIDRTITNLTEFDGEETNGTGFDRRAPLATAKKPDTTLTGYNPALEKSEDNKLENPILDPEWPLPIKRGFIRGTRQPSLTDPNITQETIGKAQKAGRTNRLSRVFDKKTRKRLQRKVNNATKDPRERSELRKKINQGVFDMVKNGDDIDPRVLEATMHNKRFWKNRGYEVTFVSHEVAKELREQAREFKNIFNNQTMSSVIRDEKGKIQFAVVTDPEGEGFWCFRSGSDDANALVGGEEQNKIELKKAEVVKNQAQAFEKSTAERAELTEVEKKATEVVKNRARKVTKGQALEKPIVGQTKLTGVERKELVKGQAEKVEKGVVAQLEKKNSLIVRPKDKKSLTVAEKTEKSLTVQPEKKNDLMVAEKIEKGLTVRPKEVARDQYQPEPYGPPLLLMRLGQQDGQEQVTDSRENDKKAGGGMSQSTFPYNKNAGKRRKKGPANNQNKEIVPKNDHSEDNGQGAQLKANTDESDAYEPNKPQPGRVYQSDVSDNSPEGQKAGGFGGANNSDVPGKPSQGRRLPFSWLWLILGSIAEALQQRRRREFLMG